MRRQSWLIILLSVLVLLKSSGLYAMVHCQTMPQHSDMSTTQQMARSADVTADTNAAVHADTSADTSAAQHTAHQHDADTVSDTVSTASHCQDAIASEHCSQTQLQAQDQHSASTCQACDHCCTIHGMAFPATLVLSQQDSHDKVLQFSYFHTSVFIPAQKRPPKVA